jgi:cytochrome c-type biogenesis protein CcmH/NrfG
MKPETLQQYAENLEKFDGAVRGVRGMQDLPPSQGNRISIFMLRDPAEVSRLAADKTGFTKGFYRGSAAGSLAFVSRSTPTKVQLGSWMPSRLGGGEVTYGIGTDTVLLHEYAHHLMMQAIDTPYPEWLVEGFAEFMSTAQFERDGSVGIGLPANHRYHALINGESLPLETILSGRYDKITVEQRESIYGRGWLLTHFLTFEPARKGQLTAYLREMAGGADSLEAARRAFGDLGQLDRDLANYLKRSKLQYLKLTGKALAHAPVTVTRLSAAAELVMPLLVQVKNGVSPSEAEALAAKVRAIQSRYAGDELVEVTLAEAELNAGHGEAAEAAAERAIKLAPRNIDALVLKGRALTKRAEKADAAGRRALLDQARKIFVAANKLDPEDPEPLMEFYNAFVRQGMRPTPNAIAALHYASDLAPQDLGLRMNSAMQYLADGKAAEAGRALAPIAYDPHGGDFAKVARQMMTKVRAGDVNGAMAVAQAAAKDQ